MKIFFSFLCCSLLILPSAYAQVSINTKIDAREISIGDQARLFFTAELDSAQARLAWPRIPDTFHHLEVVERGKIDTVKNGSRWQLKQRLLITGFDSGSFLVPAFTFIGYQANGKVDSLYSDSFRLMVNTVPVDTTKPFNDIKAIREVAISWRDYMGWIIALVLGIAMLLFVVLYFRKNKARKHSVGTPVQQETLYELTMRLLRELEAKELWQNDRVKEYYTELSVIVREYIEARFNTPAMELTTNELLQKAKRHSEMTKFRSSLKPLLHAADMAKFAKAVPLPEEHIQALELAKEFVHVSKLPETTVIQNTSKK